MSNSNNDLDLMGDDDLGDLQELYEAEVGADEIENEDFDDDLFGQDADQTVAEQSTSSGSGRGWLIVAGISLVLILLLTLLLAPMLDAQKNRMTIANDISRDLSLTNSYASQALTANGRYDSFKQSLENAQNSVNRMSQPSSVYAKAANSFFGNNSDNASVQSLWAEYKGHTDAFVGNEPQVDELKSKLFGLTNKLNETVSSSVSFVEAVAKEGRNKNTGKSKDKYLFLTSEASNLNGILSRLSGTTRGYFLPNQNFKPSD